MKQHTISAAQFFGMMFVSRVTLTISLNAQYAAGENLLDGILSYGLAMVLGFFIALPLWSFQRRYPGQSVGELAANCLGRTGGRVVSLGYILYFLLINASSLALFQIFLLDTVHPDFSSWLIVAALTAVAVYGAWQGLEALARCGACVLVILLLGSGLVFALVSQRFSGENLQPMLQGGAGPLVRGTALFLSRTSLFADMAVLLPFVQGKKRLGFRLWSGGTFLFVGGLLLLLAGCLGPYAYTQNFPVYALASITEIHALQRLDPVFVGIWMMGLLIKVGADLYACRICWAQMFPKSRSQAVPVVCLGALLVVLAAGGAYLLPLQRVLLDTGFWLGMTGLFGLGVPLALLFAGWVRHRKEEGP